MKNTKLLLFISFFFFAEITFAQNTVTYSSLSKTIDLNSGVEGIVDIAVNCYGNSSSPVIINADQSCGNNDGILSTNYTNGNILGPGGNTIIRYKFKKTVTSDTQITYKFSTNGSCFQSESDMIKITVNYKAGPNTNPPVVPAEGIYIGSWPTNQVTINEGQVAPLLTGTGAGNYTYQWYQTVGGVFKPISGATNFYYAPGIPFTTTQYYRANKSGSNIGFSNTITITVINNAPPILNNKITIDGIRVIDNGLPTGGLGSDSYQYLWFVIDEDGETKDLPDTSPNVTFSEPVFAIYLKSTYNFKLGRIVYSGSQRSYSNYVDIPHISDIQNNIISINNNQVTGSIPTGGMGEYNGDYTYIWSVMDEDGESRDLPYTSQNVMLSEPAFAIYLKSAYNFKLVRIVYSGGQRLFSNYINLPHISEGAFNKDNILTSTVYPNPTSGSINFTTGFSNNKEIEIMIYSEELGKTQSIFKGIATPNQIVQCDIPSYYPKGIYYYKIVSENKEVKTGKIIFQ